MAQRRMLTSRESQGGSFYDGGVENGNLWLPREASEACCRYHCFYVGLSALAKEPIFWSGGKATGDGGGSESDP